MNPASANDVPIGKTETFSVPKELHELKSAPVSVNGPAPLFREVDCSK